MATWRNADCLVRACSCGGPRARLAVGTLLLIAGVMRALGPATVAAQCLGGDAVGTGFRLIADQWCQGGYRTLPPRYGDGGASAVAAGNPILLKQTQFVGSEAVVRFDNLRVQAGEETFQLIQTREKDQATQAAGFYTAGPSGLYVERGGRTSYMTHVKPFMYVWGARYFTQPSQDVWVQDHGLTTIHMMFRLTADSACQVQNFGKASSYTCIPPSAATVTWEYNYWIGDTAKYTPASRCSPGHVFNGQVVAISDYSPLSRAEHGLVSNSCDACEYNDIHFHTYDHRYDYWSCSNCLEHCAGTLPCPQGCRAQEQGGDRSAAMWCLSADNTVPWGSLSGVRQENGADVFDPNKAEQPDPQNDPTDAVYDICKGRVGETPCSGCVVCPYPASTSGVSRGVEPGTTVSEDAVHLTGHPSIFRSALEYAISRYNYWIPDPGIFGQPSYDGRSADIDVVAVERKDRARVGWGRGQPVNGQLADLEVYDDDYLGCNGPWVRSATLYIGSEYSSKCANCIGYVRFEPWTYELLVNTYLHELSHIAIAEGHVDQRQRNPSLCPAGSVNCSGENRNVLSDLQPADVAALLCRRVY